MKDNSETRGSTTGTQGNVQSETSQQKKGSQFANQARIRPGNNPGPDQDQEEQSTNESRQSATQQPGKSGPVASHSGSTGTGSGQISPQTHDTANANKSGQSGSSGRGNQNS
jgi:hypothetical protein